MKLPDTIYGKLKFLVTTVLFLVSVYSVFNEFRLISSGNYTKATIIDLKCLIVPERINPLCLPIVRFKTLLNQEVIYQFNINQSFLLGEKRGGTVSLYYQDSNPQNVEVNNFSDKYISLFWDILMGSVAFIRSPKKSQVYLKFKD